MISLRRLRKIPVWGIILLLLTVTGAARAEADVKQQALQFDGKESYVIAGLKSPLDGDLTLEAWVFITAAASLQERIVALWGSQGALEICINGGRLVLENSGGPSKGIGGPKQYYNDGLWHHVVIKRYERTTYALHIDGVAIDECPGTTPSYSSVYMGVAPGRPFFGGLIDEVRVYNRCLTDIEVFQNYTNKTPITEGLVGWWKLDGDVNDSVGTSHGQVTGTPKWVPGRSTLSDRPIIHSKFYPDAGKVNVEIDSRQMGSFPPDASWEVVLRKGNEEKPIKRIVSPIPGYLWGNVSLAVEDVTLGEYNVHVRVMDSRKSQIGEWASDKVTLSERPAWTGKVKILNNLVWEFLNVQERMAGENVEYTFTTPRDQWVFFRAMAGDDFRENDSAEILIDAASLNERLIVLDAGKEKIQEAMRYLSSGRHTLTVVFKGKASLDNLIVRVIPELIFDEYLQNHNLIKEYPPRDLAFMKRSGLSANLTSLLVHGGYTSLPPSDTYDAGKRWIENVSIGEVKTAADYERWLLPLEKQWVGGISIDEFMRYNTIRTEAVIKLLADVRMKGKFFYPYVCSPSPSRGGEEGVRFLRMVMDAGYHPFWERYLQEQANEGDAANTWDLNVRREVKEFWEQIRPNVMQYTTLCLGNFLSSPPESLNVHPTVDFKVWMDMQFNMISNDPMFFGLAGIMQWGSGYADEENLRWFARLLRHYAIEGRTEMLSEKYGYKYQLSHVRNPDFDEGTDGWHVKSAEEGSVTVRKFPNYSALQGRYPLTHQGDSFLWMKRSEKGANAISQEIQGLVPGKLYSLKMYTSDYRDMVEGKSVEKRQALSIKIENVELLAPKCFQSVVQGWHWQPVDPFNREHPFWMNYHVRVFRAKDDEARLTISDWVDDKEPGASIGEEIIYNFIEVQPYLED